MGAPTKSRRFGQVSPNTIISRTTHTMSSRVAMSPGAGGSSPIQRKPFGGTKLSDVGGNRLRREARSSVGSSHPSVTDESREVAAEGSESSITSRGGEPTNIRDLSFDLEQPWQRSLLRELENIENSQQDDKHARPRSHKILLGRAQSGDYIVEYSDDDDSTITDSSSTLPIRPQAIHRKLPVGHAALFQGDEDEEGIGAPSTDSSLERRAILDGRLAAFGEARDGARDLGTDRSDKAREDGDGQKRMPPDVSRGKLPSDGNGLQIGLARANALVEDRSGYLRSRSLRLKSDEETTATDADYYYEPAACMCMGYNILDYFEKLATSSSTTPSSTRRKKRRTSLHGPPPPRRSSALGTVGEEETTDSPYLDLRRDEAVMATGRSSTRF